MARKQKNKIPEELIVRYLSGESTQEEEKWLREWIAQKEESRKIFEDSRLLWNESDKIKSFMHPDMDKEWQLFHDKLKRFRRIKSQPVVTFRARKRQTQIFRIAAMLVIGLFLAVFVRFIAGHAGMERFTAMTPAEKVMLPDGSVVTLNLESTLIYPRSFKNKERRVKLKGEAFFEIKHNAQQPFIVTTGNILVKDMGTTFNIRSQKKTSIIKVSVFSGKVGILAPGKADSLVVLPGEQAIWNNRSHSLNKTNLSDPNELAWKTRIIQFNGNTLREVLNTLEEVYHVRFSVVDGHMLNCRVTATFDHETLDSVMKTLSDILDISFQPTNKGFMARGRGC